MTVVERALDVVHGYLWRDVEVLGHGAAGIDGDFCLDIVKALADAGLLASDDDLAEFERARAASRAHVPQLAAIARGKAAAQEVLEGLNREPRP